MENSYLNKLESILSKVEDNSKDMSKQEWKELTTTILRSAINREKAHQEATEMLINLTNSIKKQQENTPVLN